MAQKDMQDNHSLSTVVNPAQLADLDVLLTDAFLTVATHLAFGRFSARKKTRDHPTRHASVDLVDTLQRALDGQAIPATLRELAPSQAGYGKLRQALARYRQIAANDAWPVITPGPTLHMGVRHERVVALRHRLRVTGDLAPFIAPGVLDLDEFAAESEMRFDSELDQAVRAIQSRHGLQVDGVVGPKTLAALNMPVDMRIRQIELNLERWRQQSRDFGARYLVVNIPAFKLYAVENDQAVMAMRVVVGKPKWRTPLFQATMTHLVINPYWVVPRRIGRQEIAPKVLVDPAYLRANNMEILQGQGSATRVINPSAIDWSVVSMRNFPYRFRQRPGSRNALGHIKFKFPNAFSVYMHDTPARSLFAKHARAFSHGCVRLEQPVELAAYLLQDTPTWTAERIQQTIRRGSRRYVNLPRPIEVHMVYRTVWVDEEGNVQFRPDIYGYDKIKRKDFKYRRYITLAKQN